MSQVTFNRFRLRLSHFLLICIVSGAALGLFGKAYIQQGTRYQVERIYRKHYLVESLWERKPYSRDKLIYIVAFAEGPIGFGRSSSSAEVAPAEWGISLLPSGVYLGTTLISSPQRKVLVYSACDGRWGGLFPIETDACDNWQIDDFSRLEQSDVWKKQIAPLVESESARFAKLHKESPNPTDFWNRVYHQ